VHNRKNWIHFGSEQVGPKVAAILSVIESCRRMKLPVRQYLGSVLPGLANRSIRHVAALTPAAWAAARPYRFDVKPGATLSAQRVSMAALADFLKVPAGGDRRIIDETGLKGEYDFELKWTPLRSEAAADTTTLPTIFTALQSQLGLKLQSETVKETFYTIRNARVPDN
jgi:uncharacterized protein (TIGR03435 family)